MFDVDAVPADDWPAVGALLRRHGCTTEAFRALAGVAEPVEDVIGNTGRYSFFYLDRVAADAGAAAVLLRLFLLGGRVPAAGLDVLGDADAALLRRTGLVAAAPEDPALVRATVAVTELRGRHFLADPLFEHRRGEFVVHDPAGRCMPPHASSLELLGALRRPPGAASFLDVGCGSGCQSVLFARDYERVAGLDQGGRQVRFARANARLNGFAAGYFEDRWETFAPEAPFDHVAFNTPSAAAAYTFIDAGLGKLLAPGGLAQVWAVCELVDGEAGWLDHVTRRLRTAGQWEVAVRPTPGSRFAMPPRYVREQRLPTGTLLVDHPSKAGAYLRELAGRGVTEVTGLTIDLTRR